MKRQKRFRSKVAFVLILTIGILGLRMAVDTVYAREGLYEETADQETAKEPTSETEPVTTQTPEPEQTRIPEFTPAPIPEATSTPTPDPVRTPDPTRTPIPEGTPSPKALGKVKGVKLSRYATNAIKVTWNKQKKAGYYRVYYSKKKAGSFQCAGVTKDNHYLVKKLKNNTTYYFYVQACKGKKKSETDSAPSAKVHMKTRTYSRKTIFAGDSICQGIGYPGWAYPYMNIGGKKKVVAYRGLNTVTFHTKRVFKGKTGLQKLIAEKPYRVYMMLGMNEIHYRKTSDMITEYRSMVQAIQQACPHTDIVLCAISPVTRAERARHSGFSQITVFNKKLKKLAKNMGVRYFDYTGFLKDAGGYLKASYAERDGYHWKMSVYPLFAKVVARYDKSLDR